MTNYISQYLYLRICCLLVIITVLVSCVPQKQLRYLQTIDKETYTIPQGHSWQIKKFDELFIRVTSFDPKTDMVLNGGQAFQHFGNLQQVNLISYSVDGNGEIEYPFIGKVKLEGKTLEEAQYFIKLKLKPYLKEAHITVHLVNNSVTILGEVHRSGKYTIYKKRLSIFEAIGLAGDITEFGNRKNVLLLRQQGDSTQVHKLNLTETALLTSEHYLLQPNDVVIVEPLKQKRWGFSTFPYAVVFSGITTLVVLLQFLRR